MSRATGGLVVLAALAACGGDGGHANGRADAGAAMASATGGAGQPLGTGGAIAAGSGGSHAALGSGGGEPDCELAGCGRALNIDTDRVDLLFVVDDSNSMRQEQEALAAEFPRMLRKLTSGDHDGDGVAELPPVKDLHLGVVSTDLGDGIGAACSGEGDEGRLVHVASHSDCKPSYPAFLSYALGDDATALASDFACLAQLGTSGCGFEQPLESALKALWPSADPAITFLGGWKSYSASVGQGDRANAGFVRRGKGGAALAIVVVSDEDDCSVADPAIWTPMNWLDAGSPLYTEPLDLRCFLHPEGLYPLDRYLNGYRAQHAADAAPVLFAAIVGVPVDLVDQDAMAKVDFGDAPARDAYYQGILDDPRMQEVPDPNASPAGEQLTPSCTSAHGKATPPRRMVELARSFGGGGLVQSICGDNFSTPVDRIVRKLAEGPD